MLRFRRATIEDSLLYLEWANDALVRTQSFNSTKIEKKSHIKWFNEKIQDNHFLFLLFENEHNEKIGQVRFQIINDAESIIGISIADHHRNKGYAGNLLKMATEYFFNQHPTLIILAYIKKSNFASAKSFSKAGFIFKEELNYQGHHSFLYVKNNKT